MNTKFSEDIKAGLSLDPKRLSSKYFNDKKGDEIFQAIMKLPEYYLTRSAFEILERNKDEFVNFFNNHTGRFHLIGFGARDGLKTKILLKGLTKKILKILKWLLKYSANDLLGKF